MKFVDPKTDIAFKKIFGNDAHKSILIEFLNEILELDSPIETVTINNAYQVPRLKGLKETTLDVKATDKLKCELRAKKPEQSSKNKMRQRVFRKHEP